MCLVSAAYSSYAYFTASWNNIPVFVLLLRVGVGVRETSSIRGVRYLFHYYFMSRPSFLLFVSSFYRFSVFEINFLENSRRYIIYVASVFLKIKILYSMKKKMLQVNYNLRRDWISYNAYVDSTLTFM